MTFIQLGGAFHQSLFVYDLVESRESVYTLDNREDNYAHSLSSGWINCSTTNINQIRSEINRIGDCVILPYGSDISMRSLLMLHEGDPEASKLLCLCEKYKGRLFLNQTLEELFIRPKVVLYTRCSKDFKLVGVQKCVIKPNIGSGSKGVVIKALDEVTIEDLERAAALSIDSCSVLEEYIDFKDKLFCEGIVVDKDIYLVFGISRSSKGNLLWDGSTLITDVTCKHYTGYDHGILEEVLKSVVNRLLGSIFIESKAYCAFNIDFAVVDGRIFIIEFAPRPGGNFLSMYLEYQHNIDYSKTVSSIYNRRSPAAVYFKSERSRMLYSLSREGGSASIDIVNAEFDSQPEAKEGRVCLTFPYEGMPISKKKLCFVHDTIN